MKRKWNWLISSAEYSNIKSNCYEMSCDQLCWLGRPRGNSITPLQVFFYPVTRFDMRLDVIKYILSRYLFNYFDVWLATLVSHIYIWRLGRFYYLPGKAASCERSNGHFLNDNIFEKLVILTLGSFDSVSFNSKNEPSFKITINSNQFDQFL